MSNALKRIKPLIGHSFIYQGHRVEFQDWSMDGEQLILETDQQYGQIKLHLAHVPAFLLELEPTNTAAQEALEGVEQARAATVPATATAQPSQIDRLLPTNALTQINDALLDSIRKVQADPAYIPQAKAISDAVQVAVNVSKLQIEAARLSMQAQRKK